MNPSQVSDPSACDPTLWCGHSSEVTGQRQKPYSPCRSLVTSAQSASFMAPVFCKDVLAQPSASQAPQP